MTRQNSGNISCSQLGNMGQEDVQTSTMIGNYSQFVSLEEHQVVRQQVTHLQTTVHQVTQGMATLTDTIRGLKGAFADFSRARSPTSGLVRTESPARQPEHHERKSKKRRPTIEVSDP
jgi:hypothetical protein